MISTYTLNHLGIVSGLCEELRLRETVDALIPPDPQQKVTTGQAVVAMIVNGLGFSNRRLYLFPQFFEYKPVDLLVGKSLSAEDLNDDTIGRALDRLFNYGCTELFCHVASIATEIMKVDKKFGHLDTTTFSVHGDYESSAEEGAPIHVTYGHSKQKRPDLKQIFLNLLVSSDGAIPLFMQTLNGNSSDVTTFRKTVTEFRKGLKKNLKEVTYWIADSCFYAERTLKETKDDLLWISRVPERLKEVKQLVEATARQLVESKPEQITQLVPFSKEGYSYKRHRSTYADVEQRWLVVHSVQAESRVIHSVQRAVQKEHAKLLKSSKKLQKKEFKSKKEARQALQDLQEKTVFHTLTVAQIGKVIKYKRRGRPSKSKKNNKVVRYCVDCTIIADQKAIDLEVKKNALFVLATNELSCENLSDQEVFEHYKGQMYVERGFRFLKDPLFFASSLFLKKPQRIVALTTVICLSLLVYSIGERKLRKLLEEQNETIRNQVKKPTQKPTLRWIFELFEDVHLVKIEGTQETQYKVTNLRPDALKTLEIFGKSYLDPYLSLNRP